MNIFYISGIFISLRKTTTAFLVLYSFQAKFSPECLFLSHQITKKVQGYELLLELSREENIYRPMIPQYNDKYIKQKIITYIL